MWVSGFVYFLGEEYGNIIITIILNDWFGSDKPNYTFFSVFLFLLIISNMRS